MTGRLILVRHGQSHANVQRRLDTRPPGAELTVLGVQQAQEFARMHARTPGLLAHSVARRAAQTARAIGTELSVAAMEVEGIHEVQAGNLEGLGDEAAIAEFNAVYRRWHQGELEVAMPGGETGHEVLDRYLPVITDLRVRYLDDHTGGHDIVVVSHGAAIRLAAATLADVPSSFVLEHHLANTEAVALTPVAGGRWRCEWWGSRSATFDPDPDVPAGQDGLQAADPMG